jgi:hypothetical protein
MIRFRNTPVPYRYRHRYKKEGGTEKKNTEIGASIGCIMAGVQLQEGDHHQYEAVGRKPASEYLNVTKIFISGISQPNYFSLTMQLRLTGPKTLLRNCS